jgi:two-component system C4-dicarboxylate transport response regulator DctD
MRARVLIVDDDDEVREACAQAMDLAGFDVDTLPGAEGVVERLSSEWPGVVISDMRMPRVDGLELLRRIRELDPDLPVVLLTGHGDVPVAVEAMREGAYDFLEKPCSRDRLGEVVTRALEKRALVLENRRLRASLNRAWGLEGTILGISEAATRLRERIAALADTDVDVLIRGATGTGKDVAARALHDHSQRADKPFVAINCGALPENIIESELFGHEAGAFTGAVKRRIGKFEHAHGGTVFLDEIESMPLALQVRLLRVLQERSIERLGSNTPVRLDVRVIAATKRDLREASDRGDFREDLYYRINVVTLDIPALKDRPGDVAVLFRHFVAETAARYGREPPPVDAGLVQRLSAEEWRGNVRELRNFAERHALGVGEESPEATGVAATGAGFTAQVEAFERSLIEHALRTAAGSVKAAHEALQLPRKTFYDRMRKYGLSRSDFVED